ncbi:MAG: sugar ABC transporter permease, partial [Pseudomonadota bacterium]
MASPAATPLASPTSRVHLWFAGPAILLMFVILIVPIFIAAGLSFTNYSLGNSGAQFVGLENYERIFTRSTYEKMFIATFT